jgi:hypothetical protein
VLIYEPGPPQVRAGEELVAGRRIAGRLLPYGASPLHVPRFDPVARRFVIGRREATVACAPPHPRAWGDGLAKLPPGPVLVGPGSPAEPVRGSLAAAAEAAADAGRAVYLLDPDGEHRDAANSLARPAGATSLACLAGATVLCAWRPGPDGGGFPGLREAARSGAPAAAVFPLIPEWTAGPHAIRRLADAARDAGAAAFVGLVPDLSGEARRAIVEARAAVDPAGADGFFEAIHHGDWTERLAAALADSRVQASGRAMAAMPPRPAGRQPRANAAAAARLEETAELSPSGEHRDALLLAAARWIDESVRDLGAIAREGNFRRIFPWSGAVADESEAALLAFAEAVAGR